MKRFSILIVLTAAFLLAFSGVAYANFGIHGGYSLDTDACAGCHRAHTSISELRWNNRYDPTITHSALLVSSADTMTEFCNTCHGSDAPGASTNVADGIFDAGPSAPHGTGNPVPTLYVTNSSFGATLNAGGFDYLGGNPFEPVTSAHSMDATGTMWGFGASAEDNDSQLVNFTCTSCHDVHGSTNYRLLRDSLPGGTVGGYLPDGVTPQPWVISAEQGYPAGGWLKHEQGAAQMALYRPNYTSPEHRNQQIAGGQIRSISGWCAGCHQQYIDRESLYDYGAAEGGGALNSVNRHRHPVNVTLGAGVGPDRSLPEEVRLDPGLPLERAFNSTLGRTAPDTYQDFIGCLTCHRAHGTSATMSGWAVATMEFNTATGLWGAVPTTPTVGVAGVEPNMNSSLLRYDNRGVCQRCHNQ